MKNIEFIYMENALYIIIPILIIALGILGYKKKVGLASFFALKYSTPHHVLKMFALGLGLMLIVIGLLGPTKAIGEKEIQSSGLDVYVLLDTSKSMLSQDVLPSRLDRLKMIVESLLEQLDGDRIGFIPFASSAYIQMPLTDDYDLAKMFLGVVDTDMISGGGSNLAKALEIAMDSFDVSAKGDKAVIILSDGEEHDGITEGIIDDLKAEGIKVYSVGIGTLDGALIPEYSDDGLNQVGFKKDSNGDTVLTKLNEELLVQLASATGGTYYMEATTGNISDSLKRELGTLKEGVRAVKKVKNYEHLFQYFLVPGVGLLLLGLILSKRGFIHEKTMDSTVNS